MINQENDSEINISDDTDVQRHKMSE